MAPQPGAGSLTAVPANQASYGDLQAIFGTRGQASRCQCQRYKLAPLESFGSTPVEERAHRLRVQTSCGDPGSPETNGLAAYLDGVPVVWCAVEPRCNYESLLRNQKVPWSGRDEDKQDGTVWAVTCLFARAGFRRQGISRTLVHAAVRFARDRGARAIEAYPMTTSHAIVEELHCGLLATFIDAGFTEVSRPTTRRAVLRVELASREDESTRARKDSAMSYTIRPLDASTWRAFAELVERNNGIFGGCWCIGYHPECGQKGISHRAVKEDRVRTGRAHAALVLDEDGAAQGWCQYGSPEELPGIKHKREYEKDEPPRPHWRITCFYVDKKHRGQGIARAALEGALDQIAYAGGGLVEAISEVTTGREAPGRFLFSATVELFEQCGFTRGRQVGKHARIVSRVVDPV